MITKLNCSLEYDEVGDEFFISYSNDIADVVSKDNPDIEVSISEYKRIAIKGGLQRKGEILCTLYKKLESIENKFKGTDYKNLANDTTFLFNKTGIRHWKDGKTQADRNFTAMDSEELEKWYDKTYDLFLSCMVISKYLDEKKEIDAIKKDKELTTESPK